MPTPQPIDSPEPTDGSRVRHRLASGWSLSRLRRGLLSRDPALLEPAANDLLGVVYLTMVRHGERMLAAGARNNSRPATGAEDLAMEATERTFALLVGKHGDGVCDESHLVRILFLAVRSAYADALRLADNRLSEPESVRFMPGERERDETADGTKLRDAGVTGISALRLLFVDGECFAAIMKECGAGSRHFRQYRAFALYETGAMLADDLLGDGNAARFWARFAVEQVCVPEPIWACVEAAARDYRGETHETGLVRIVANAAQTATGGTLQNRAKVQVLRHEVGQLRARRGAQIIDMVEERHEP